MTFGQRGTAPREINIKVYNYIMYQEKILIIRGDRRLWLVRKLRSFML